MSNSNRVWFTDVAARDGFQIEPQRVSTETKVETINALGAAGVPCIEATSFVHPKAVPQMADAEEVMKRITRYPGTRYTVLVPNLRGAERALACKPDMITTVVSVSDSHNRANIRRRTFETLNEFEQVAHLVHSAGVTLQGAMSTTFGCAFEGRIPLERVLEVVEHYVALEVDGVVLADTTGMANPAHVRQVIRAIQDRWPDLELHMHFHNTRGMGLANVYAAYLEGVRHFEGSLGGIGGCPFAPGATGNICTEDAVHMFMEMGVETGIDLDRLLEASRDMERALGHELPGQVMKAGRTLDLHPLPPGEAG
ncbi:MULTISPECIES: hydroxymethylglutaryl-CoA lyase [Paenibacillus]|uniref:hydroxymethylglutaryl-CoA lyase n=1 Tax=Paenibacillus TaxID=44249 RepID=UPI00114169AA|nr:MULTISPECIES: hydroxymethylglutaryl-CoA lyase [unclassified Paenibacillus]